MIDVVREIEATRREVGERDTDAGKVRSVRLSRDFDSPIDDVWDAFASPERLGRWFLPVTGDFRLGGTYQFEGNAGGKIVECDRPNAFKVTWFYGDVPADAVSEVRKASRMVTKAEGGKGAVREVVETLLKAQGLWDPTLRRLGWHA